MKYCQFACRGVLALACGGFLAGPVLASSVVPNNFYGANQNVNGFQDNFTTNDISSYTTVGDATFSISGGYLNISGGSGDPSKLLYSGASYNGTDQNVLAMIEVTGGSAGDGSRGGVATDSDSSGDGINALFRRDGDNGSGDHVNILNDAKQWGPATSSGSWTDAPPTFYWLRLTITGSGAGQKDVAEIWPADGHTSEALASTATWDAATDATCCGSQNNYFGRSGLAGLVANSNSGNDTFKVNYLLIQAPNLGPITALPEPASLGLVGLGVIGLLARRRHA